MNIAKEILDRQRNDASMDVKCELTLDAHPDAEAVVMRSNDIVAAEPDSQPSCENTKDQSLKRLRIQDEHGQMYVIAVSDAQGTLHEVTMADHFDAVQGSAIFITKDEVDVGDRVVTVTSSGQNAASTGAVGTNGRVDVSQNWFTSKTDKKVLQNAGHNWKQGQWAKEEIDILQENINAYCRARGVSDPAAVIFEMSKDERKDFYRVIAKGLDRPLFSVYRRVVRMYDQKNHVGKYTSLELNQLRELRARHGNDWATIGSALGRSAGSVRDRCRLMKEACNSGKWFPEEEARLTEAVYELAGVRQGEEVTQGLSWSAVAERVASRSEKQCRAKWLNYLNWKHKGGTEWTKEDDAVLIGKVMALDVQDEADVDWVELAKDWPSVRSPQWLRGKWWNLKRHITHYQVLPFRELVSSLAAMHGQCTRLFKTTPVRLAPLQTGHSDVVSVSLPLGLPEGASCTVVTGDDDSETAFQYEVIPASIAVPSGRGCGSTGTTGPAFLMTSVEPSHSLPSASSFSASTVLLTPRNHCLGPTAASIHDHVRLGCQVVTTLTCNQHTVRPTVDLSVAQQNLMSAATSMGDGSHSDDDGHDSTCGITTNRSLQTSENDHLEMLEDSSGLEDMGDVTRDDSLTTNGSSNVVVDNQSLLHISSHMSSHMSSLSDPLLNSSGTPELEGNEN